MPLPWPHNVVRADLIFTTGADQQWTVGMWLLSVDVELLNDALQRAILFFIAQNVVPEYLSLMHDGVISSAGRLTCPGFTRTELFAPAPGSHTSHEANSVVCTLHWIAQDPQFSRGSLSHLSGVPFSFVNDDVHLSSFGWSQLADGGLSILHSWSKLPDAFDQPLTPVCVRRKTKDGPLDHAQVAPIIDVRPGPMVSSMRRRMPSGRRSPSGVPIHFP